MGLFGFGKASFFKKVEREAKQAVETIHDAGSYAFKEDGGVGHVDPVHGNLQGSILAHREKLPCPVPIPNLNHGAWHVIRKKKYIVATLTAEEDGAFRVDYVPNEVGANSGFGFHAAPRHAFPKTRACLSYKVFFPEDFDWARGGKLPGLFIGHPGASGGNWEFKAGSARVTWQKNGIACVYLYIPLQVSFDGSKEQAIDIQSKQFQDACHVTKKGCHLWHSGPLRFVKGQWNDVTLTVTMNTIGQKDGSIELSVNGEKMACTGMVWRTRAQLAIGGISMQSFYGGSAPACAVPSCGSYAKFKDFTI
jgi:hypothetical protein